jgi:ZIP family zinc transporter
MLSVGISPKRTFGIACLTGAIEVVGTFIGYFAVALSSAVLPFALALAGGTMIYVISEDMLRDRGGEGEELCGYALLIGFSLMLIFNFVLS